MSKKKKLLDRLLSGSKGWSFSDLRTVAGYVGIEVLQGKGDHWKFRAPGRPPVTVDPGKGGHEVLHCYVRAVRDLVQEILDEQKLKKEQEEKGQTQEDPDEREADD